MEDLWSLNRYSSEFIIPFFSHDILELEIVVAYRLGLNTFFFSRNFKNEVTLFLLQACSFTAQAFTVSPSNFRFLSSAHARIMHARLASQ